MEKENITKPYNQLKNTTAFYALDISIAILPERINGYLSLSDALNYGILPIGIENEILTLVTNKIDNFSLGDIFLRLVKKHSAKKIRKIKLLLTDYSNMQKGFQRIYDKTVSLSELSNQKNNSAACAAFSTKEEDNTKHTILVDNILKQAINQNASDIHITPFSNGGIVQFRIDGKIRSANIAISLEDYPYVVNIIKAKAAIDTANKLVPQDGSFIFNNIELRINTTPTVSDEKINCRLLNVNASQKKLENLGLPDETVKTIKRLVTKPYGIVLMTGPTGEGKSTTLYACLREHNPDEKIILSFEDPVEQRIEGIAQGQVKPVMNNENCNFNFAKGLRASLRQDPDIIFVGEIRDKETGIIAVQASQTGHLLFSTLHCRSAIQAIQRMADLGIGRNSFLYEMNCIMSQRLVGINCPHCRKKIVSLLNVLLPKNDLALLEESKFSYESIGCAYCNNTGFSGRKPILEIIEFDNEARDYFSQERGLVETEAFLHKKGFRSLWSNAMEYITTGELSLKELFSILSPDEEVI